MRDGTELLPGFQLCVHRVTSFLHSLVLFATVQHYFDAHVFVPQACGKRAPNSSTIIYFSIFFPFKILLSTVIN